MQTFCRSERTVPCSKRSTTLKPPSGGRSCGLLIGLCDPNLICGPRGGRKSRLLKGLVEI